MQEPATAPVPADSAGLDLLDVALPLVESWRLVLFGTLATALVALAITFAIPKTYTSRALILPPQQQQSTATAALSQLGALSGLAGMVAGVKSSAEQYVTLLQSAAVTDRLIDQFDLTKVYDTDYRFEAREELASNVRILLGKKDGLITIEVDDESPQRAADMANRHIDELRRLTRQLALTEAQQRRVFFEAQLTKTRDQLTAAQQSLQASGFSQGALRADARASAEGYARLRAEATATEVRLQTLRRGLSDNTPEVQQALSTLSALRSQLTKLEESTDQGQGADYVSKFREFKYQETLFELFAKQYELARLDESRDGTLIQVVDTAQPAEWKSRPKRALITAAAAVIALVLLCAFVVGRKAWDDAALDPDTAGRMAGLRAALGRR